MSFFTDAKRMLVREEGNKRTLYYCTAGMPTIGVGHNLKVPISQEAVDVIFEDDLRLAQAAAGRIFGEQWGALPQHVRLAVVNMIFQLGGVGFSSFVRTIDLMKAERFEDAAMNALKSKWAVQTPARAKRVSELLKGGNPYET